MTIKSLLLGGGLLVAGSLWVRGDFFHTMADDLSKVYFGADSLSATEWDAQAFNSGSATHLVSVTLNLFRDEAASGTYWVRLYDQSGPGSNPGSTPVATLASELNIADLSPGSENVVGFFCVGVNLQANRNYYIVVGTDTGATGLRWGFTNDPLGARGFPSLFSFTPDSGASWRLTWTPLPQRMRITGFSW